MQRHIFLFLHLIIFISSSLGFFRVARCPSFSGTILRFEGMSHLLLKIFLFTALLSTVGFLRVASQGRAAGGEMINYCNTVKKKSRTSTSTSPQQRFELIRQECLSWKVSHQISTWGSETLSPGLWEDTEWEGRNPWKDFWTGHRNTCLCHFPREWLKVVCLRGKGEENIEQLLSTWCYAWQLR